jgi:manganese transport protein
VRRGDAPVAHVQRRTGNSRLTSEPSASSALDAATVRAARGVLAGQRHGWRAVLPFLGPAFIASVAYIDPGNFATNIQSGAQFGYLLLWVVVASNLMAMLIQTLSAKLGIATGKNLAEVSRDQFPTPVVLGLWLVAELAAMATDVAEVLGAAIGIHLLFGLPLLPAGLLTGAITFALLGLQGRSFRSLEFLIALTVGVIAACYVVETILDTPDPAQVLRHAVIPQFQGTQSVLLAVGILGATVMPHVVFLHSHLTQGRIPSLGPEQARRVFHFETVDVVIAMTLAGLVNAAMLIMAAATFNANGYAEIASIEEAHATLAPLLGPASAIVFAVSLTLSGLSSSTVGTMAGQVVMQGYLHRTLPLWLRRLVTLLPAYVVIVLGLDPTNTLVISQVILSFCLPAALIPLVLFTRRRDLMGVLVNRPSTTALATLVAGLIVALNALLVFRTLSGAS